jgi:tripeptide aminopeptidase
MDPQRLLERFLRYVRIDTTAREGADVYPSSPGQLELGRMLVDELLAIGLTDAAQDAHGIVMATLPSNAPRDVPVVAFCAHLDTSPETTGANVRPQVVRRYDGRDLTLPGDTSRVIRVAENPELADLVGNTIITSDGTTLLGADDKAGVAVIMEAMALLAENPQIVHGPLRVCLTCDEEIGRGVDHVELARLGAAVCYTLDGGGADVIDVETFSADLAVVSVRGVNIHPSIARGRMVNALRVAAAFVDALPRDRFAPEVTADRDGFLHPYHVEGGVAQVSLRILLRDFETAALADQAQLLRLTAAATERRFPGAAIDVSVRTQYRNMREGLAREPRAVGHALEAWRRRGRTPRQEVIRGGTDGSRLTELGLPTPNLSTGEHNPHSPLEWTCLEEMVLAVESLVAIAGVWADPSQPR